MKAAMTLSGLGDAVFSSLAIPALGALGLKGMACLPISKQLDSVMGVDAHIMVPPGSPVPAPYIGILIYPKDFLAIAIASVIPPPPPMPEEGEGAPGEADTAKACEIIHTLATMAIGMLGATVKIGNFIPRAVAGTTTRSIPHIGNFVPPPMNRGHAYMGSLNVLADGDPLSGGGAHLHMDCWDIGLVTPHAVKKEADYFALFLPTGMIVPIPWFKPILTNPIPIPINPMEAAKRFIMGRFAGYYKKKMKRIADKLHGMVNDKIKSNALKDALHKTICTVTGHPVDVATGNFFTDEEDFYLSGPLPISWERTWYSQSDYSGPLGYGWHHSYDMGIVVDADILTFRMNDGRPVAFPLPSKDSPSVIERERIEARVDEDGNYSIWDIEEDLFYHFTTQEYDEVRLLERVSDNNGFCIRFSYNRKGHLTSITDSAQRVLRVETDEKSGRILAIYAPHPDIRKDEEVLLTSYRYDEDGNMVEQCGAEGDKMLFDYKGRLMTREVWRNGLEWFFEYDGTQTGARCIHTWGTQGIYNHKLTFFKGKTEVLNSFDRKTVYYHKDGLVYRKEDPNGNEVYTYHNRNRQIVQEQDAEGGSYLFNYDDLGNLISSADPEGGGIQASYFKKGLLRNRPFEVVSTDGGRWKMEYDEAGNLTKRTNPKGAFTEFSYKDGLLDKIVDEFGVETLIRYDEWLNITEAGDSRGNITRYEYDRLGRCTKVINAKGAVQERKYDLLGRIVEVSDFDGNHIELTYDGIDNLLCYKDNHQKVEYAYEGMWKLMRRKDERGVLFFEYDNEEQLRSVLNEGGERYRFTLDPAGRVIEEIGFDKAVRSYVLDRAGRVIKETLPSGKFKEYRYDKAGRVTRVSHGWDEEEVHTYSYYASGRLQEAVNEHATVSFKYDNMGLPTEERSNEHVIKRTFDKHGLIATLKSSMGADLVYNRNEFGELVDFSAHQTEGDLSFNSRHSYDSLGFEIERMMPGGVARSFAYDNVGRLVDSRTRVSAQTRRQKKYHWGAADRLLRTEDSREGTTAYEYTSWGHLQKATYADGRVEYRTVDKIGNLFDDPDRKLRKYLEGSRMETNGEWRYGYDKDGNLVERYKGSGKWWDAKREHWKYAWNDFVKPNEQSGTCSGFAMARNRTFKNQNGSLAGVQRPDRHGHWVEFTYDALGRRLSKSASERTNWLWNGNVPLHEWTSGQRYEDKGWKPYEEDFKTWIFEESSFVPLALLQDGHTYSIMTDHLGTPTEMYDENGEEVCYRRLDMNGKIIKEECHRRNSYYKNVTVPFLFQGQYYDYETELAYNRFRYYDPSTGTYISQDPIGLAGGNPTLYGYVFDSNTQIDPFGLDCKVKSKPQNHQPIPKFLGGDKKQFFSKLPKDIHKEFHSLLNQKLKQHGLPLPDRGPKGSAALWDRYMASNPGSQRKAFDAVLDAAREIDFKHGTDITSKFWENIINGSFKVHP